MPKTETTPHYGICLEEEGKPLYVASGSHGWSLHSDMRQATMWENEQDAVDAQQLAPARIKFDGRVVELL